MGSSTGFSLRETAVRTHARRIQERGVVLPTAEEEKQNQEAGFKKARGA
jgi:hypothetical protein